MKKIFSLMILFLGGLMAISIGTEANGDFISDLNQVKNPFVSDLPPEPIRLQPKTEMEKSNAALAVKRMPIVTQQKVIELPHLTLQGVIIGPDIHQAIIDNQIIGLQEKIQGAKVINISPDGVGLDFKGKHFFLKTATNPLSKEA